MKNRAIALCAAAMVVCLIPMTGLAVVPYSQDFEGLVQSDINALTNDGWLVYGNAFLPDGSYLYGYGVFPAPNDGAAFCQIDVGQGGVEQGEQQLVVFNDYNNVDHANGYLIEANVFQEQTVTAENVGTRWVFEFQAKMGNLEGSSTALAFIKTLDPNAGYATTNFITADMTAIPETWSGFSLFIDIDASLEGQLLQIGFANTTTSYQGAGIYYDNLILRETETTDVPDGLLSTGAAMRQNFPNPFNPLTRIEFSLVRQGNIDISVFDIAGRRVATLFQGQMDEGEHFVTWNGKTSTGSPAAAGQYSCVLKTAEGQVSRSMVLVK